jgi:spore germination protein
MLGTRRGRLVAAVVVVVAVAGVAIGVLATRAPELTPEQLAQLHARAELAAQHRAANAAKPLVAALLPTTVGAPAPTAALPLYRSPLPAHWVVGYVPYWELGAVNPADLSSSSVVVYSSVCPTRTGGIEGAGAPSDCANGFKDLSSPALRALVADAHADGDRVLLSVETTDNRVIKALDGHAARTAPTLAAHLVALEQAAGFDGTNIDIEGTNPADREPFVGFVRELTSALRRAMPSGTILADTYANAAIGRSFFDPKRLAPLVDALFVMNYALQSPDVASAASPLETNDLGYSTVATLMSYTAVVPRNKIILGLPFYGTDFSTTSRRPGAAATNPYQVTYASVVEATLHGQWDPVTETPFAHFSRKGTLHQVWYDDPVSLALKVALASRFRVAGVGAWAYGMEGDAPLMLDALTGGRPPLRSGVIGTTSAAAG